MMVTTRKTCDSKVIAMDEKTGGATMPQKTLLEEVNPQLICVLCKGYYIDATTIVECLHSFCRSCIIKHLQVKSYCPICEMMINSAKPNIKPDKALQDIVYKLVPGLFQREMQRRQSFYASRPGAGASATPEQRGEDTERIIFSPEDVISFSLEYMDCSESDNVSSKSSESGNESSSPCNESGAPTRRYLQCPAVVNISHLKKFLSMKYDIDATHFFVDILYKRVPLPDYYTLMDIAYIYNWKRNEPMRFFYQISDFTAIGDRFGFFRSDALGDRKGKGGGDSGAPSSPAPSQATEGGSDASSGSFSPLSHEKGHLDFPQDPDRNNDQSNQVDGSSQESANMDTSTQSSSSVDVEKSQFLNSFELTAKSSVPTTPSKVSASPSKDSLNKSDEKPSLESLQTALSPRKTSGISNLSTNTPVKVENQISPSKRKHSSNSEESSDSKKVKVTPEKSKEAKHMEVSAKELRSNDLPRISSQPALPTLKLTVSNLNKPQIKVTTSSASAAPSLHQKSEDKSKVISKPVAPPHEQVKAEPEKKVIPANKNSLLKRKAEDCPSDKVAAKVAMSPKPEQTKEMAQQKKPEVKDHQPAVVPTVKAPPPAVKVNSMVKMATKPDAQIRPTESKKEVPKSTAMSATTPRPMQRIPPPGKSEGNALKSLFDSCNINIPSSLSITLTDQKDQNEADPSDNSDQSRKTATTSATTSSSTNTSSQKSSVPSPQVHNYVEIVKIPEDNSKGSTEKSSKPPATASKPPETPVSTKGPVPNLKPIADVKVPITKPQTFQQTFLQSLQQQCEKPKYIKNRLDFPKIPTTGSEVEKVPTTESNTKSPQPSTVPSAKYKPVPMAQPIRKPTPSAVPQQSKPTKPDSALDLSTPHPAHSQLGAQHAKNLETMQNIENLAKKQAYSQRLTSPSQVFSQDSFKMNTSNSLSSSSIRIPVPPHSKHLKTNNTSHLTSGSSPKHFPEYFSKNPNSSSSNNSPVLNTKSISSLQSSTANQRSMTRSPSSSPKLVIACPSPKSQSPEEKQLLSPRTDSSSQSSLVSSSQISSTNHNTISDSKDTPKSINKNPGPHKSNSRMNNNGNPSKASTSNNSNTAQLLAQQAYLRQQLDLQTQLGLLPPGAAAQWFNNPVARAHFENIMKNMAHNTQMPFASNHSSKENK